MHLVRFCYKNSTLGILLPQCPSVLLYRFSHYMLIATVEQVGICITCDRKFYVLAVQIT